MKKLLTAIATSLKKFFANFEQSEAQRLESYLSQAQDIYHLEQLQRNWDNARNKRQPYF